MSLDAVGILNLGGRETLAELGRTMFPFVLPDDRKTLMTLDVSRVVGDNNVGLTTSTVFALLLTAISIVVSSVCVTTRTPRGKQFDSSGEDIAHGIQNHLYLHWFLEASGDVDPSSS